MQGDAGGKFSILGDNSVGHCEKMFHMNMYIIVNGC